MQARVQNMTTHVQSPQRTTSRRIVAVARPGRQEVDDPRMWKKTAMVCSQEAAVCDEYASAHTKTKGRGRNLRVIERMTRSDVVRAGTLALLDEMTDADGTVYMPDEVTDADDHRTVRIAGVFTQAEMGRIKSYQRTTGMTYSNILREGMLRLVRGELDGESYS